MKGTKIYLDKDVLSAAQERISFIFDRYENIVCSLSGGKDSTVMVHLALAEAKRRGRKINVFWLDQEAEYQATEEQVSYYMNDENVNPYWYQVPCYMTNSTSFKDDMLYAWDPDAEDKWMRKKSDISIHEINEEYPKRFYKFIDYFESKWDKNTTCFLVGLRAEESLNRFRATTLHPGIEGINWTTSTKGLVKAYPLYDWTFEDVWIYISKFGVKYNKIYDFMWASGSDIADMRVSNLIHEKSFKCLCTLPRFEPETYNRLMERIGGIHVAARYAKESTIFSTKKLPSAFKTWKEYRDFLLETSPVANRERFLNRFKNQPNDEIVYRGQCKQILLNDWENNMPTVTKSALQAKKERKKQMIEKWRNLL